MPFRFCNAPATFKRLVERVLSSGPPWEVCCLYLDDIIMHATTFKVELERLCSVFTRLQEAGLKLSQTKCHLFKKRVVFLGHNMVSEEGVSIDPGKIKTVCEWLSQYQHPPCIVSWVSVHTTTNLSLAFLALLLPYTVSQKIV